VKNYSLISTNLPSTILDKEKQSLNAHIEKIRALIMNNPYKKHLKYLDGENPSGVEHLHRHAIYTEKYQQYDNHAAAIQSPKPAIQVPKANQEEYSSDGEYSEESEINRQNSFVQTQRLYQKKLMQPYVVKPSQYNILHTPDPSSCFISPHATARISQYKKFLDGETTVSQLTPNDLKEKLFLIKEE